LHWNVEQVDKIGEVSQKALEAYDQISKRLGVEMHSRQPAERRIKQLLAGKEEFMKLSRDFAERAQRSESLTTQPKENLSGVKGKCTITNYLGGHYYFTCDEVEIHGQDIYLIEAKHTNKDKLPSTGDVKDGLLKMMLFTNLKDVRIEGVRYNPIPILKLTTADGFRLNSLSSSDEKCLAALKEEAQLNGFRVIINEDFWI